MSNLNLCMLINSLIEHYNSFIENSAFLLNQIDNVKWVLLNGFANNELDVGRRNGPYIGANGGSNGSYNDYKNVLEELERVGM